MRFALNHITTPRLSVEEFFALARKLGMTEVEVRNDTPDVVSTRRARGGEGGGREGGRRDHLDQRALSVQRLVGRPAGAGGGARRLRQGRRGEGPRDVPAQRRHGRVAHRPRGGAEGDGADPARARAHRPRRAARLPDLVDAHQAAGGRRQSTRLAAATSTGWCTTPSTTTSPARPSSSRSGPASSTSRASWIPTSPSTTCSTRTASWSTTPTGWRTCRRSGELVALGFDGPYSFEPFAREVQELADPEAALRASMAHVTEELTERTGA